MLEKISTMHFRSSFMQIANRTGSMNYAFPGVGTYAHGSHVFDPELGKCCPVKLCSRLPLHHVQKKSYATRSATYYYDVLGVSSKATQSQIKSAYFSLSKLYHPDLNKTDDAETKFAALSEAYDVLGNVQKRRQYDRIAYKPSIRPGVHDIKRDVRYPQQTYRRPFRPPPTGSTSYYNFDEFYRNHYAESFRRDQETIKKEAEFYKQQEEKAKQMTDDVVMKVSIIGVLVVVMAYLTLKVSEDPRHRRW